MEVGGLATQRAMDELGLPEALLAPLEEEELPLTFLQASVWAEGRTGTNLLIQGPSGPETTVAFSVLLLKQLLDKGVVSAGGQPWEGCRGEKGRQDSDESSRGRDGSCKPSRPTPQLHALVLTRNREITSIILDTLVRLGQLIPKLVVTSLVGGVPLTENIDSLAKGCHVAVGTPGRVRYLMAKGALKCPSLRTVVLESADWLTAPVFQEDVAWIACELPENKQVLAFSTTEATAVKPVIAALAGVPTLKEVGGGPTQAEAAPDKWQQQGTVAGRNRTSVSSAAAAARAAVAGAASIFMGRGSNGSGTSSRRSTSPGSSATSSPGSPSGGRKALSRSSKNSPDNGVALAPSVPLGARPQVAKDDIDAGNIEDAKSDSSRGEVKPVPDGTNPAEKGAIRMKECGALTLSATEDMGSSTETATPSPPSSQGSGSATSLRGLMPALAESDRDKAVGKDLKAIEPSSLDGEEVASLPRLASGSIPRRVASRTSPRTSRDGAPGSSCDSTPVFSPKREQLELEQLELEQQAAVVPIINLVGSDTSLAPVHEEDESVSPRDRRTRRGYDAVEREGVVVDRRADASQEPSSDTFQASSGRGHPGGETRAVERVHADAKSAAASLLEGWNIPAVLLKELEADGRLVPTPLMASVWTAGRGDYRADLLVHGCPGEETATAYAIPILERVMQRYPPALSHAGDSDLRQGAAGAGHLELQALVLTRTRDMAASVTEIIVRLGRGLPGLTVAMLIGGVSVSENAKALTGGCHVAVGTPGRIRFLMTKGLLRTSTAQTFVLDSADWLMAPVFQEDVGWIAKRFPKDKQLLAFSGADPAAIQADLQELVDSPHMAAIGGYALSGARPAGNTMPWVNATSGDAGGHLAKDESLSSHGEFVNFNPGSHIQRVSGMDVSEGEHSSAGQFELPPTPTPTSTPAAAAAAAAVAAVAGAVAAGSSPIAPVPRRHSLAIPSVAEEGDLGGSKTVGMSGASSPGAQRALSASFTARVRLSRENQLYGAWCRHAIGGVGGGLRR